MTEEAWFLLHPSERNPSPLCVSQDERASGIVFAGLGPEFAVVAFA
jgi:hypothetical protein